MSSKRGNLDRTDSWGAESTPRKWPVVVAVAACACSVVVLFFTASPGPETAASAEAAITKSATFELRAVRSLSHIWAGYSDTHARRRLATLTESAVPFTIVFSTIGRDPILQRIKAQLELVPPHDASAKMLEAIEFPLRYIAAFTALVSSGWLGWAAVRAAMD